MAALAITLVYAAIELAGGLWSDSLKFDRLPAVCEAQILEAHKGWT